MVGVSGPEFQRRQNAAWRFVGALTFGFVCTTVLIGLILSLISFAINSGTDPTIRAWLAVIGFVFLGCLDILGRTPHVDRQVPQKLATSLSPGPRGLLWGLDLGALLTTQKSTSLIWAALLGATLLSPLAVFLVLGSSATVYLVATAVATIVPNAGDRLVIGGLSRPWLIVPRLIAGLILVAAALVTILSTI